MRTTFRALLAVGLLLGFYLLAAVVVAGFVVATWLAHRHGTTFVLVSVGFVGLTVTWTIVVAAVMPFRRRRVAPEIGLLVTDQDQPALWAHVRDLAERVGTRPPDEIRLIPMANAYVSEESRLLGLRGGTRRMGVGVPFLLGMTRDQLSGVLCHELGHYAGRHMALGPVNYRGLESVHRVVDDLGDDSVVGKVFRAYAGVYLRTARSVARSQEVEADRTGAGIVGRDAMIAGFREMAPIAVAWDAYHEDRLDRAYELGMWPEDLATGFLDYAEHPARAELLAAVRDDTTDEGTDPLDTHPSTIQRVALLATLPPETGTGDDGTPAFVLLSDPDAAMAAFADAVVHRDADHELRTTTWAEAGPAIDRARDERYAWLLVDALSTRGDRPGWPVSLADLATALRSGRADEIARAVSSAERRGDVHRVATILLTALLRTLLVRAGHASYALDWSARGRVVDATGATLDVEGLAERAVEPAGADEILAFARFYAMDVDHAILLDRPDGVGAGPEVLGAMVPVRQGWRYRALLVCSHGLAVVRPRGLREIATFATAVGHSATPEVAVGQILGDRGLDDVLTERGALVLRWDQVVSVQVRKRMGREPLITVTMDDGTEHRLSYGRYTGSAGHTWEAVQHFLGERLTVDRRL